MDGAGNLYGTTVHGGCLLGGMAFKINPSGKLTVLHCFGGPGDGEYPYAGLVMDALGNLYGTTTRGGVSNYGTVFKIDSSGNESLLYQFFDESDGSDPRAGPGTRWWRQSFGNGQRLHGRRDRVQDHFQRRV
jgi:uncharacterized repeat protein (TIGR03803 family)